MGIELYTNDHYSIWRGPTESPRSRPTQFSAVYFPDGQALGDHDEAACLTAINDRANFWDAPNQGWPDPSVGGYRIPRGVYSLTFESILPTIGSQPWDKRLVALFLVGEQPVADVVDGDFFSVEQVGPSSYQWDGWWDSAVAPPWGITNFSPTYAGGVALPRQRTFVHYAVSDADIQYGLDVETPQLFYLPAMRVLHLSARQRYVASLNYASAQQAQMREFWASGEAIIHHY